MLFTVGLALFDYLVFPLEIVDYLYQLFVRAILEAEARLDSGLLSDQTEKLQPVFAVVAT